jgi:hypothetical protein
VSVTLETLQLHQALRDAADLRQRMRVARYLTSERVGDAPVTVYEVANACRIETAEVQKHVHALNADGWRLTVYAPVITEAA